MQYQFGAPHKTYLRKIVTLQNKAVKNNAETNWNYNANPSYKNLNVLKLSESYKLEVGKVMHLIQSKQYPHYISFNFTKVWQYHVSMSINYVNITHYPKLPIILVYSSFI